MVAARTATRHAPAPDRLLTADASPVPRPPRSPGRGRPAAPPRAPRSPGRAPRRRCAVGPARSRASGRAARGRGYIPAAPSRSSTSASLKFAGTCDRERHDQSRIAERRMRRQRSRRSMLSAVSRRTGAPQRGNASCAARAYSSFRWSFSSVIVPTVERDVRTGLVWSIAMAGGNAVDAIHHAACPCGRGIAARTARRSRRSDAAPRHRPYRTPARTCRSRTHPSPPPARAVAGRGRVRADCSGAPLGCGCSRGVVRIMGRGPGRGWLASPSYHDLRRLADTSPQKDSSLHPGDRDHGILFRADAAETRFFALFNRHAEFVVEGGRLVADLVHELGDERRRADLIRRIGEANGAPTRSRTTPCRCCTRLSSRRSTATTSTG